MEAEMKRIIAYLLIMTCVAVSLSCDESDKYKVLFSYKAIMDREFKFDLGRAIPLTIEKSVETDGDFSLNERFLYFSSNRAGGNYDLYLRDLTDITTVRITAHPSGDISPAVSPDGKYLAFVSMREDPEGDIYIIKIDPESIIKKSKGNLKGIVSLDEQARNLTQIQDPSAGTVLSRRDSNPSWSPDGKWIAFSSTRGGQEDNLWLMKRDGGDAWQVTKKGGMYPAFSSDGKRIVFVSYREGNPGGDVYVYEIDTANEKRITNDTAIKLSPSFYGNGGILYTRIERDSNVDGRIDLDDNAVLQYMDNAMGVDYPLTLPDQSSFGGRWINALKTPLNEGIVLYSERSGDNININLLPDGGLIPRKKTAFLQYTLAETYLKEHDDYDRYLMALERVYYYFRSYKDDSSQINICRALADAGIEYKKRNDKSSFERVNQYLQGYAGRSAYARMLIRYRDERLAGRDGINVLEEGINEIKDPGIQPFLLDDMAAICERKGQLTRAADLYRLILKQYPSYPNTPAVRFRVSYITFKPSEEILPEVIESLNGGTFIQRMILQKHMLEKFRYDRDSDILTRLISRYDKDPVVSGFLLCARGEVYLDRGHVDSAIADWKESLKRVRNTDYIFYRASVNASDMLVSSKDTVAAEKLLNPAVNRYMFYWKDPKFLERVSWLIDFYELQGERQELSGNYAGAVELYRRYADFMGYLHRTRKFAKLYNQYGPRAQVLLVDAMDNLKGGEGLGELADEYVKNLSRARIYFDKAYLYGLAYIYTKQALIAEQRNPAEALKGEDFGLNGLMSGFSLALEQINWALFFDDTFTDPYLLKTWIYQYLDLKRRDDESSERSIGEYFPRHLFEDNIETLEKALAVNDEVESPGKEGDLHLTMANNYFLLNNFPRASRHFDMAAKYKKSFGSPVEEAIFHFHRGYCFWQTGDVRSAREEIVQAHMLYESIAGGKNIERYSRQMIILYKYYALFYRWEGNFTAAIEWYGKILVFADSHGIPVDRARYLQEMAECYMETGNTDQALAYLDRVETLLKKYPDDEKKYRIRLRFFGIGPFLTPFSLDRDSLIIGENRLFEGLDTGSKKLLNLSLQEKAYSRKGDGRSRIRFLERKIALLEGRTSQFHRESLAIAYNNAGFYWYREGDYLKARDYFEKAWTFATKDPGRNILEAATVSVMNIANLYADLLEGNVRPLNAEKKIADLVDAIKKYRDGYRDERFAIVVQERKAEEEAYGRILSDEQKEQLKNEIDSEVTSVYFKLDIASAVLQFYRAELVSERNTGQSGIETYKLNQEVFDLYSGALKYFSGSIPVAQEKGERALQGKLLLNRAACLRVLGETEEAYEEMVSARTIAEENMLWDLQVRVYWTMAEFLMKYGRTLEGEDYLERVEEMCAGAQRIVEIFPEGFVMMKGMVHNLYKLRATLLARKGEEAHALDVLEREKEVTGIMMLSLATPGLYRTESLKLLNELFLKGSELRNALDERVKAIANGAAADGIEVRELSARCDNVVHQRIEIRKKINAADPDLAVLVGYNGGRIRGINGRSVFRFLSDPGKGRVYAWTVVGDRVQFKSREGQLSSLFPAMISSAEKPFVVLDDEMLSAFRKGYGKGSLTAFRFIPSVASAARFDHERDVIGGQVFYQEGSAPSLPDGITVVSSQEDLAGCDIVIQGEKAAGFTVAGLFSTRSRTGLVIRDIGDRDADYINLYTSAARYAGVGCILFRMLPEGFPAEPLEAVANNRDVILQGGCDLPGKYLAAGSFCGKIIRAVSDMNMIQSEQKNYTAMMESRNFDEARLSLERWRTLVLQSGKKDATPDLERVHLEIALGNRERGLRRAEELIVKTGPETEARGRAVLLMSFLHFRKGDWNAAETLLDANSFIKSWDDYRYLEALRVLVHQGVKESLAKFDSWTSGGEKRCFYEDRLALLYNEYLGMAGSNRRVEVRRGTVTLSESEIISLADDGIRGPLSENDIQRLSPKAMFIARASGLLHENPSTIVSMAQMDGYDEISPLAFLRALALNRESLNPVSTRTLFAGIDLEAFGRAAAYPDAVHFLSEKTALHVREGDIQLALETIEILKSIQGNRFFPACSHIMMLERARVLADLGRNQEAFIQAMEGLKTLTPGDPRQNAYIIIIVMMLQNAGNLKGAELSLGNMSSVLSDEEKLSVQLLQARSEIIRLSGQKAASRAEGREFEKLFLSALDFIDAKPEVLSKIRNTRLLEEVTDEFINYSMRTGYHADALAFAEIKRELRRRILFGTEKVAGKKADSFTTLRSIRFEEIMASLSSNTCLVVLNRNRDDIFAWILTNKTRKAFILDNKYNDVERISTEYRDSLAKMKNIYSYGKKLAVILDPVLKSMDSSEQIFIVTDRSMEPVPYEILGDKFFLEEKHRIVFLGSIMNLLSSRTTGESSVRIEGDNRSPFFRQIEAVAIRETGIRIDPLKGQILHCMNPVTYNILMHDFIAGERAGHSLNGAQVLYLPAADYQVAGSGDLSQYLADENYHAIVVNDAAVHDINNALFVDVFYTDLLKGKTIGEAFSHAKETLRTGRDYRHPAYWAGIRLYLNAQEKK